MGRHRQSPLHLGMDKVFAFRVVRACGSMHVLQRVDTGKLLAAIEFLCLSARVPIFKLFVDSMLSKHAVQIGKDWKLLVTVNLLNRLFCDLTKKKGLFS